MRPKRKDYLITLPRHRGVPHSNTTILELVSEREHIFKGKTVYTTIPYRKIGAILEFLTDAYVPISANTS